MTSWGSALRVPVLNGTCLQRKNFGPYSFHYRQISLQKIYLFFFTISKLLFHIGTSLTFWHRSFTFNSNKSLTWWNSFLVYYLDVCLQLNMFRAFSRPSSGAQWLQWQPLVLPSYRDDSRAVLAGWPARPRTQHDYHHDTKVKPSGSHWAPDDGRENARNMLSCKQTSG